MKTKRLYLFTIVLLILCAAFLIVSPGASQVGVFERKLAALPPLLTGCGGEIVAPINLDYEQDVIDLVNQERSQAGLSPLLKSGDLTHAADYHAADMAQDNYLMHDTYDYGNPNPVCLWYERLGSYYPGYRYLGENIASGQQTPQEVMADWMNSDGHRANILNPDFSEIGVGYAIQSGSGTPYWVQDFGDRGTSPALGNIPSSLVFIYSISDHELIPATTGVRPENSGNADPLTWTISGLPDWLQADPIQGSTPNAFTLTPASYDTITPADYTGTVTVTATGSSGVRNSPAVISVSLHVVSDPFYWIFLPQIKR